MAFDAEVTRSKFCCILVLCMFLPAVCRPMSHVPSTRSRDNHDENEQPPRQRRKINDNCLDEPDIILLCDDGVEYLAHKSRMSAACELFENMFRDARPDVPDASGQNTLDLDIPVIPLLESSTVASLILPLAYRQSPSILRGQSFETLSKCIAFAHRLGMPVIVDSLARELEVHATAHSVQIYEIACRMDLEYLRHAVLPAVIKQHKITKPYTLAADIGIAHARVIHDAKLKVFQDAGEMLLNIQTDAQRTGAKSAYWHLDCRCANSTANNKMSMSMSFLYCALFRATTTHQDAVQLALTAIFKSVHQVKETCEHWNKVRKGFEDLQNFWEKAHL